MEKFSYSFFARIIYRYGNIIATLFLSIHLISSIYFITEKWYFVFPTALNGLIIYILNRYFLKTYRLFPFTIEADNEKMICSDFFMSRKRVVIHYKNIDELRGGIFSGYPTRPIYLYDKYQNITVGFYSHVGEFQKLLTKILQYIPEGLYNKLLNKIKTDREKLKRG